MTRGIFLDSQLKDLPAQRGEIQDDKLSVAEVESAVASGLHAELQARQESNEAWADELFCDLLTRSYAAYALPTDVQGLAPSTLKKYERWVVRFAKSTAPSLAESAASR